MRIAKFRRPIIAATAGLAAAVLGLMHTAKSQQSTTSNGPGPDMLPAIFQHAVGNAAAGKNVFRYTTFGNQGFWTTAMQLPQGIAAAKITPLQALQLGLNVNIDAVNAATLQAVGAALQQVLAGTDPNKTAFGDPNVTLSLINQNAVMGVVVFDPSGAVKAPGNTGTLNLAAGDSVGLTCAACHSISDNSVLGPTPALKITGSIGKEIDGPSNHAIDVGAILAVANRSLAYYPMLQQQFKTLGNATIGRGNGPGLLTTGTTLPTEAQVDAYLTGTDKNGRRYYPVGQFDALPDGIGNPVHIPALFRTDLSAPWGTAGDFDLLDDFNNFVYTVSLDPTSILTPGGREFLHIVAGPVGDEIASDYQQILQSMGLMPAGTATAPYVVAQDYLPAGAASSPVGRRVDNPSLLNLNAYLNSLQAPAPGPFNATMAATGRTLFMTNVAGGGAGCTGCHQLDPNKFVPTNVVPMNRIYPGYNPTVLFNRTNGLSPIQASFGGPSPYFDNRAIVVDGSLAGTVRGSALPLKLDLARRTSLLHDDEITGATFDQAADNMMNPAARDPKAAHPFYVAAASDRAALIEFMKSLGTSAPTFTSAGVANAASYMGGSVAPGEVIAISGSALGIPMAGSTMANTTATFDGVKASLVSVTTTQVTAIVPYEVAGKTSTSLQVTANGQTSIAASLPVAATAPGIFTLTGSGSGQAAVLNQDGSVNSMANPAARGSVISVFATGEGQTNPGGVDGTVVSSPAPRPVASVTATVGGQTAQVSYAGGSPGLYEGLLQVNLLVPTGASAGNVSLQLNIGGIVTQNNVTLWLK